MIKQLGKLLVILLVISSCNSQREIAFGDIASLYMPPAETLKQGILYKFYKDIKREKEEIATDIFYQHYLLQNDTLTIQSLDAGFEKRSVQKLIYSNNVFKLLSEIQFFSFHDPVKAEISDSITINWDENSSDQLFKKSIKTTQNTRTISTKQIAILDTFYNNLESKKFVFNETILLEKNTIIDTTKAKSTVTYGRDIGIMETTYEDPKVKIKSYLVEQVNQTTFEILKSTAMKRASYIDPKTSLIPNPTFQTCKEFNRITDNNYGYNFAHLEGRKDVVWSTLDEFLDPAIIRGESGFLTVRFVINCKGEIGRFKVEQADLDFQNYTFSDKCIRHLVEITNKMKPWIPAILLNVEVDSYAYIIYKIKDGEIIDILP